MKNVMLLALVISNSVLACDPVKLVDKGAPAPCTGYLFSLDKEKEVRINAVELEFYKELTVIKERQVTLIKEENEIITRKYDLWKVESETLSKEVARERTNNFWRSTLYFALGVLVTTGLTYAVRK